MLFFEDAEYNEMNELEIESTYKSLIIESKQIDENFLNEGFVDTIKKWWFKFKLFVKKLWYSFLGIFSKKYKSMADMITVFQKTYNSFERMGNNPLLESSISIVSEISNEISSEKMDKAKSLKSKIIDIGSSLYNKIETLKFCEKEVMGYWEKEVFNFASNFFFKSSVVVSSKDNEHFHTHYLDTLEKKLKDVDTYREEKAKKVFNHYTDVVNYIYSNIESANKICGESSKSLKESIDQLQFLADKKITSAKTSDDEKLYAKKAIIRVNSNAKRLYSEIMKFVGSGEINTFNSTFMQLLELAK